MKKNIVLIMLDSLQFNYVGCYGNEWIKTPNLDKLASEGTLFENAYAEGLPTVPVRRAMLTGRFTLPFKGWGPLDNDDTTIADIMWGRGVHTALIYDSAPMRLPKYGYSRGFDDVIFSHGHELDQYFYAKDTLYHLDPDDYIDKNCMTEPDGSPRTGIPEVTMNELPEYLKLRQNWKSDDDSYVGVVASNTCNWLHKVDKTKPFLLWVDSFDPHEPWDPPSVWEPDTKCPYDPDYTGKDMIIPPLGMADYFTEEQLHHIRMLYAENVTVCDKHVGKILDKIKELGLWDDTLIMVMSDHGEPMGHGEHGHGIMRKCRPWPYEELVHVPMIVRYPGYGEGKRVKGFVQTCDVAPTMIDYLAIKEETLEYGAQQMTVCNPDEMQGISLLPIIRGEAEGRDFAIAGYYGFSWSIITHDYSYIHWIGQMKEILTDEACFKFSDMGGIAKGEFTKSLMKDEMWTCTPNSEAEMPEEDQLFDRKSDPFQLKNILKEKPSIGKELLKQLMDYMAELRTT
ncbi:sulfatase [Desulfoluna sp.]|uniref:sulfatase n=1 Tax=Desulfoluna sp. TaxID=2045199 RepID=UPI002601F729|nr:sulfatase [Desulfoluna sp.]